jgi:hypothetical protein
MNVIPVLLIAVVALTFAMAVIHVAFVFLRQGLKALRGVFVAAATQLMDSDPAALVCRPAGALS